MWYGVFKYVLIGPARVAISSPARSPAPSTCRSGAARWSATTSRCRFVLPPLHLTRRITYLAKAEYFTEKGVQGTLKRWFFTCMGQVPIDAERRVGAHDALTPGSAC